MKKLLLVIAIIFSISLQSCFTYKKLPPDFSKSTLLIELLPTNMEKIEGKSLKTKLTNMGVKRMIKVNTKLNEMTRKGFRNYPFKHKFVTEEQVGDNIASTGPTYFLKNGVTIVTVTRKNDGSSSRSSKTEVLLENLSDNKTKKLAEWRNGVAGMSKRFTNQAIKLQKKK